MKLFYTILRLSFSMGVIAAVWSLSGCGSCPDDIKLGDLTFQNSGFFPLRGEEDFTFVNQLGDKLVFTSSVENKPKVYQIAVETLCKKPESGALIFGDIQASYYDAPMLQFRYNLNKDVMLFYRFSILKDSNPAYKDTVLYESFDASLITGREANDRNDVPYISSDRGNSISPQIISQNDMVRIISDTTINGNHYTNLYCQKKQPTLFYSTAYGIVLFQYKSDWWYLKH